MDCVNHNGVAAAAYCQNCGKALCVNCTRQIFPGQILCETCLQVRQQTVPPPFTAPPPFAAPHTGANPILAAILGFIPGVGAMYNGQFLKGFLHVVIFAVLISMHDSVHVLGPLFGLLVAGWVFYQVFDAYHTAKARREGLPLPDPLGLNEFASNFFNQNRPPYPGQPGVAPTPQAANPPGSNPPSQVYQGQVYPGSVYQGQPYQGPTSQAGDPANPAGQSTYQPPYATPYTPPPVPPTPPAQWRRREPVAAIVLIVLGLLFLLGQFDIFSVRIFHFTWPLLLICLGAWLVFRRMRDSQGGPQ